MKWLSHGYMLETNAPTLHYYSMTFHKNPDNNRITAKSASIVVKQEVVGKGESTIGHWVMPSGSRQQQQQPLYTRYQPQECRGTDLSDDCKAAMNNTHKEAFSFVFREADFVDEAMTTLQPNLSYDI